MTATVGAAQGTGSAAPSRGGFRDDIQGLRAVAVLLVLGYHAGIPQLAGGFVGVDVFFVISGFLITGLILKEVDRTGTFSLASFYSRRARRLLPATAVVLLASAAITLAVIPVTRWATIVWDLATSALYVTNWWLADQSVDYLAAQGAPSPVQHFWTLAVEEQFYVVWPLLLLLLIRIRPRTGLRLRPLLLGGIVALALASFVWSVHLTADAPGRAYFVTTTRIWELAIGAVLAFGVTRAARMSALTARVLAVVGLAAIVYAAVTFDAATPFPGASALLPTLGTAAVIAAGTGRDVPGVGRLLSNAPMRRVGGLSYSLYLWHWPLLVGAQEVWATPGEPLPVSMGLLVVTASAVPAWLTYRYVEAPVHHWPALSHNFRRNAVLAAVCTLIGVAAAVAVAVAVPVGPATSPPSEAAGSPDTGDAAPGNGDGGGPPGAAVLGDDPARNAEAALVDTASFVPGPVEALADVATLDGERCIQSLDGVELAPCHYGPATADTHVAVVGDSKMHQWLPAIQRIADERGWRVITHLKSGCPLVTVATPRDGGVNQDCLEHNERRFAELLDAEDIDLVLTSQRAPAAHLPDGEPGEARRAMVEDLRITWDAFAQRGMEVMVVLDNPAPPMIVPDCVATNRDQLTRCAFDRQEAAASSAAPVQLAALDADVDAHAIALEDWICPGETCPAVLGGTLVYRQGSHLTATYVESLTDRLDQQLNAAMAAG